MADQELILRIRADLRDVQTKLRRLERDGGDSADGIARRFERAGRRISNAFRAIRGPALAAGAAGAGLAVLAQRSLAAAENIQDLADRADVSAEFLQELRVVASQSGASTRDFDDAISRLNRRLGLFIQSGGGPAAQAFERLGINTRIASGELANSEQVFDAAVAALEGVESAAERSAIASQLFGEDSGPRLAGLLARGTAGITEFRENIRSTGEVMSNELVANAAAASDALERVQQQVSAQVNQAIATQADNIVSLGRALGDLAVFAINAAAGLGSIADEMRNIFLRGREVASLTLPELRSQEANLRGGLISGGVDVFSDTPPEGFRQETVDRFNRLKSIQARIASLEAIAQAGENSRRNLPTSTGAGGAGGAGGGGNTPSDDPFRDMLGSLRSDLPSIAFMSGAADMAEEMQEQARKAGEEIAKAAGDGLPDEFERNRDQISNSIQNGLRAAFDGNLLDFIKNNLQNAAFEGLANAITNAFASEKGTGLFGSIIGGLFGGGIGRKASGGPASGLTLVGEQGPELVALGGMANVMTANMTRMAMSASKMTRSGGMTNVSTSLNIDARGAEVGVEERIRAVLSIEGPRLQRQAVEATISALNRSQRNTQVA